MRDHSWLSDCPRRVRAIPLLRTGPDPAPFPAKNLERISSFFGILLGRYLMSATRPKNPKDPSMSVIERFGAMRDGIRGLFKVIRTLRVLLRHVEACLVELHAVSTDEVDASAPLPLPPPAPHPVAPEPNQNPTEVEHGP